MIRVRLLSSPYMDPIQAKIDQNSRQNFILRGSFSRETCRSRQDLQVTKSNLPSRMKSYGLTGPIYIDRTPLRPLFQTTKVSSEGRPAGPHQHHHQHHRLDDTGCHSTPGSRLQAPLAAEPGVIPGLIQDLYVEALLGRIEACVRRYPGQVCHLMSKYD